MFKFFVELTQVAMARAAATEAEAAVAVLKKKLDDAQDESQKLRDKLVVTQKAREEYRKKVEALSEELWWRNSHYHDAKAENKKLAKQVEELMNSPDRRLDRIESYLLGMQANALGANVKVEVNNG